jgi:hypothetical protein
VLSARKNMLPNASTLSDQTVFFKSARRMAIRRMGGKPPFILQRDTVFAFTQGLTGALLGCGVRQICRRILRAFVGRGLLEIFEAKEMLAYQHSGFSVDAGATTAYAPPPLLWGAGTELATQGSGEGHGGTRATDCGTGAASRHG